MDNGTIYKIIENHQHYLKRDVDNWEEMRADFSDVSFPLEFDFNRADLRYADFDGARLSSCDMSRCRLDYTTFRYADMYRIDLHRASLRGADLRHANLMYADLVSADLYCANLDYADLNYICARNARFNCASLVEPRMAGADMSRSCVYKATIRPRNWGYENIWNGVIEAPFAKELPHIPLVCPEAGSFIGYKKCTYKDKFYIVVLKIPADAKRSSGTESKCRCSKAKVIAIQKLDGTTAGIPYAHSIHDVDFQYVVGETVIPNGFDENRFNVCAEGIHFFMDRMEAVNY